MSILIPKKNKSLQSLILLRTFAASQVSGGDVSRLNRPMARLDFRQIEIDKQMHRQNCIYRGIDPNIVDSICDTFSRLRLLQEELKSLFTNRKRRAREFIQGTPSDEELTLRCMDDALALRERINTLSQTVREAECLLMEKAIILPNSTHPSIDITNVSSTENLVVNHFGEPFKVNFKELFSYSKVENIFQINKAKNPNGRPSEPMRNTVFHQKGSVEDHVTLGSRLGIIDFKAGSRIAGSGFYCLQGQGALLEMALVQHALRSALDAGWELVHPPDLVHPRHLSSAGFFPRSLNHKECTWSSHQKTNTTHDSNLHDKFSIHTMEKNSEKTESGVTLGCVSNLKTPNAGLLQEKQSTGKSHVSSNRGKPSSPCLAVKSEEDFSDMDFLTSNGQVFYVAGEKLCLAGTSEISMAAMFSDEILNFDPVTPNLQDSNETGQNRIIKKVGISHCFRNEGCHGGSEDRGLYRVRQFTKVELFVVKDADQVTSDEMLQEILNLQKKILEPLRPLLFRTLQMRQGKELGTSAYQKYDCEVFMPFSQRWGEVASATNCTDFQSRRFNIRYRNDKTRKVGVPNSKSKGLTFAHTLNGTACAVPRLIQAILESCQLSDGSIQIPEVLQKYMLDGSSIIK